MRRERMVAMRESHGGKVLMRPRRTCNSAMATGIVAALLLLVGCATVRGGGGDTIEEEWGIRPVSIRRTAAGYMLDFRYEVVDPEKAAPIMRRPMKPYLIDQASGVILIVPAPPKVGALRQTTLAPTKGRIYFVMFANPGGYVKAGNKVTVVIGDFRAEDLVVE